MQAHSPSRRRALQQLAGLTALGALNALYAAGYLRAMQTHAPARLMAFVALSLGCALAAAVARNLFTFFVCYVALIVVSCPPIAHGGARAAAGRYLAILLSAAILLLFPAIVWTYAAAGGLERSRSPRPTSICPRFARRSPQAGSSQTVKSCARAATAW